MPRIVSKYSDSGTMEMLKDWQNCDDIIKSNVMMLEHQYACDVHFVLGKDGVRQGAHKYILISRSTVFDVMFCGSLSNTEEQLSDVVVPDIEPEPFKYFLKYLYGGTTEINADNVIPLLYCSKKYGLTGLSVKCIAFVDNLLDSQNACAVMEQAHFFDEKEFHQKVMNVVLRKAEEVLETDDFTEICEKCLGDIVGSNKLMAKEELILKACTKWAAAECERQGLAVTDSNSRIMLGNILFKIRFPLLPPTVFVNQVAQGHLLLEEEKVDVLGRYIVPSKSSAFFITEKRIKQYHHKFNRFASRHEARFNNRSGSSAITFETSKDIEIEGFTVYGTCRTGEHELEVKGKILDEDEKVMCTVEKSVTTTGGRDVYDIMFDESVRLHWGIKYTLVVDIKGNHTFAGNHGRMTVLCNNIVFTFYHSEKSLTGTTITNGQLPGLIYSL